MQDLSLHMLDIAENSLRAGAKLIRIRLRDDEAADRIELEVEDDGAGMTPEQCEAALSPFHTTRTERSVGLGLPLLAQAAREAEGDCELESKPGTGTKVRAWFQASHPDCRPLGDFMATFVTLMQAHPEVAFVLELETEAQSARLDTRELRPQG